MMILHVKGRLEYFEQNQRDNTVLARGQSTYEIENIWEIIKSKVAEKQLSGSEVLTVY